MGLFLNSTCDIGGNKQQEHATYKINIRHWGSPIKGPTTAAGTQRDSRGARGTWTKHAGTSEKLKPPTGIIIMILVEGNSKHYGNDIQDVCVMCTDNTHSKTSAKDKLLSPPAPQLGKKNSEKKWLPIP